MGTLAEAGKTGEFEDGTKKKVLVNGHEILLARVKDRYYAVENRCPHLGGDLANGTLDGTVVTCPRHGSQFDISDGRVVRWLKGSGIFSAIGKALKSPQSLKTYNIQIKGELILIET